MNKIIIDGKEYELSEELVEKIKTEVAEQKNPFDRKCDNGYFYISSYGVVNRTNDDGLNPDDLRFNTANYCRDKELMEQRELHESLNRLLWRYSETHGGSEECGGFFIYMSANGGMYVGHCTYAGCGDVYFKTRDVAEVAIEKVVKPFMMAHPEFVW